jgi:hypothetical protein
MTLSRQTQPESVAFSIIMHLASILWCVKGEPDLASHRSHSGYFHPVQNCLACPDNFWDNARAGLRIVALESLEMLGKPGRATPRPRFPSYVVTTCTCQ